MAGPRGEASCEVASRSVPLAPQTRAPRASDGNRGARAPCSPRAAPGRGADETDPLAPGDILSIPQALQLMPIGRTTLYSLCESGALPHYRVQVPGSRRGRVLVARRDLEAFLESARHGATHAPTCLDIDAIHARVRRSLANPDGNGRVPSQT